MDERGPLGNRRVEASAEPEQSAAYRMGGCLARCLLVCIVLLLLWRSAFSLIRVITGGRSSGSSLMTNEVSVDASEAHDLRIDWARGDAEIKVVKDGGSAIVVTEEYLDAASAEFPMVVETKQGELFIGYRASRFDDGLDGKGKRLKVRIPRSVASQFGMVTCSVANGSIELRNISCDTLNLSAGSGEVSARGVGADTLVVQVSSGEAQVRGSFAKRADLKVSSGNLYVASKTMPAAVNVEVSSGDGVLALPRDASFEARVKKGSGEFDLAFDARLEGEAYLVGTGGNLVTVDLGSGDMRIEPLLLGIG